MSTCIILHNTIIENERYMDYHDYEYDGARQPLEAMTRYELRKNTEFKWITMKFIAMPLFVIDYKKT